MVSLYFGCHGEGLNTKINLSYKCMLGRRVYVHMIPLGLPKSSFLQHEDASVAMFDHLVDQNELKNLMEQHGLVLPEDLDFIREQIAGPIDKTPGTAVSFVTIHLVKNRNT